MLLQEEKGLAEKIDETSKFLVPFWNSAKIGVVLGSGLSSFTNEISLFHSIPYHEIPYFPCSTVEGHYGSLILGELGNVKLAVLSGRFHYYEGYSLREVTFPIRVLAKLGIKTLILTNAAGGLNLNFKPGDIMIIKDHINFIPDNPLRGIHDLSLGKRFVSLTNAYDKKLRDLAKESAKKLKIQIREGVYSALPGPSYETPAEVKMLRVLGINATGMSTIPEVVVARQSEIDVLGMSLITNVHTKDASPTHDEVLETAKKSEKKFCRLLIEIIRHLKVNEAHAASL
ncbi:MAG: purine-nucleoside phosphorylase [Candidatus Eremiobacteraeota bacterium]|jgi:purine-nucleoside phosphorylase|nr:purine-nucleoside phosphorylase [Candidatus Eremiobacteraeota bacterium]